MYTLRVAVVAAMTWLVVTGTVEAQPFELHGEVGGALMLSEYQREEHGFQQLAPAAAARLGWRMSDWLSVQLGGELAYFPSDAEGGSQLALMVGLRAQPQLGSAGRLFVDVNGGTGRTGDVFRPALSAGLGFELALSASLGLGPFLRYAHTFATGNDVPSDAQFLVAGISVSLGAGEAAVGEQEPEEPEEPADTDADGVPDARDACPEAVPGMRPDPERPGCPLQDSDGDGVYDTEDRCPQTPAGENADPERAGCPVGDADGDGVQDAEDVCPEEPAGSTPDPERRGCPVPDQDGDTVPDGEDACPEEAGAPSTDPERHGCPSLARVQQDRIEALEPIYFAHNSSRILPRSRPTLQAVAEVLRARPNLQITVEGHSDRTGSAEHNLELSQGRAESVMEWLVQNGIEQSRLRARGYGQTRPAVEGDGPDAHAKNRRVEFRIQQSDAP